MQAITIKKLAFITECYNINMFFKGIVMAGYVAGIDFGTSNSSAAITNGNTPRMVDVESGHNTIPTALYFPEKSSEVFYGRTAQQKYVDSETGGRFMRSMKRILGTPLMDSSTQINGHMVKFDDIIGYFISYIKQRIDVSAGENVESIVMGRPVHFRDNDPVADDKAQQELERIAKKAGFKNIRFQYEPIAAAFAHEQKINSEKLACVIDIGGGTSDFTIIRLSPENRNEADRTKDVLANTGVRIGGNDFDKNLSLKEFMPMFGMGTDYKVYDKILSIPNSIYINLSTWNQVNEVYNYKTLNLVKGYQTWALQPEKLARLYEVIQNRLGHINLDYVEKTKIALSKDLCVESILDFLSDKPSVQITRKDFNNAISNDVEKIESFLSECLLQAGVKKEDIDLVILTGGSTEVPRVSDIVIKFFPNAEISASDKLSSVGLGLAYEARRVFLWL